MTILFKSITGRAKLDYDPHESLASFRLTQSKRRVQHGQRLILLIRSIQCVVFQFVRLL